MGSEEIFGEIKGQMRETEVEVGQLYVGLTLGGGAKMSN